MERHIIPIWLAHFLDEKDRDLCLLRQHEAALQPLVFDWLERNRDRAVSFTEDELDELFSTFGVGGPLTLEGVEQVARVIEERRELYRKCGVVFNTDLAPTLGQIVDALYNQAQPYRDRR